ncbi:MAG: MarR family transcriptional regulator [Erysipelotrichaceae bacterium]|nr:MarR family transcriptional regulator [Erysipelotrichaceae bacterium]
MNDSELMNKLMVLSSLSRRRKDHHHPSRGKHRLLRMLKENGEVNPKQLADKLHIRPSSVSEVINECLAKGLITKQRDINDRRKSIIEITEEGNDFLKEITRRRDDSSAAFFSCLSEEEKDQLSNIMDKLIENNLKGGKEDERSKE